MNEEVYHLVDAQELLDRLAICEVGSKEKAFLINLLTETKKVHKVVHNHNVDLLIKSCELSAIEKWDVSTKEGKQRFEDMIWLLKRVKI